MASKGGVSRVSSVVSHSDNMEVLLIRITHWLWRWYRLRPSLYLSDAIDDMARVKNTYREPMRENREASANRIKAYVAKRKSPNRF